MLGIEIITVNARHIKKLKCIIVIIAFGFYKNNIIGLCIYILFLCLFRFSTFVKHILKTK